MHKVELFFDSSILRCMFMQTSFSVLRRHTPPHPYYIDWERKVKLNCDTFKKSLRPMITKFGKKVHLHDLTQMRLINQVLVTSLRQDHVTNEKHISATRVSMNIRLGRLVTYLDWVLPINSHDLLIARSRDKLKSLYFHYQSAYGCQTWHDSNLPWWDPAYKVTWLFDYVVKRNDVTN